MTKALRLLALLSGVFAASVAQATTYNYSYTFDGASVITGSFDGTASGNLITGLSNISASLNGIAFNGSGSLFGSSWVGGWVSGGAVASFDGTQNNFLFIDVDYPNSYNYTNYFYAIPYYSNVTDLDSSYMSSPYQYASDTYSAARWSVTAANETPEPDSLALFAIGLLGAIAARRKKVA